MIALRPEISVSFVTADDVPEIAALSDRRAAVREPSVSRLFWREIAKSTKKGRGPVLGFVARDRASNVVGYMVASYLSGLHAWLIIEPEHEGGVPELIRSAVRYVSARRKPAHLIAMLKAIPARVIEELGFQPCKTDLGVSMTDRSTHVFCRSAV